MAKRVEALDCRKWADGFLTRLGRYSRRDRRRKPPPDVEGEVKERLRAAVRRGRARGRSCSTTTARCARSSCIRTSRSRRARSARSCASWRRCRATDVHIVSGRRRRNLEQWLGQLPDPPLRRARLPRPRAGRRVAHARSISTSAGCDRSSGCCGGVAADVPGAHVERKSCSVAWHYREAEPEYGSWRAHELLNDLAAAPRAERRPRCSRASA